LSGSATLLLGGAAATALAQIVLLALLVRLEDGINVLGAYGLATAIIGVARTASEMGLRAVAATDYQLPANLSLYWRVRGGSVLFAAAVSLLACLMTSLGSSDLVFVGAVVAVKMVESCADLCYGVMQRASQADDQAISMVGRAALTVACLAVSAWLGISGDLAMWLVAAVSISWLIAYDLRRSAVCGRMVRQQLGANALPQGAGTRLAGLWRTCWPIGAAGMLGAVSQAAPRLLLDLFFTRSAVGVWTAAYTVGQALSLPNQALINAQMGRLTKTLATKGAAAYWAALRKEMLRALGVLLVLAPLAYVAAPFAMELLYGPEALATGAVLALIICARLVDESKGYLKLAQIARRKAMPYLWGTIGATSVTLALAYAFIPPLGLLGAGLSVLAAAIVTFAVGFTFVRRGFVRQEGAEGAPA
jgi:O-antigen/teichoic acid export membrane protein